MRFKYRTDVFNHIQGRQQRERLTNKQTNKQKGFGQKTTDRKEKKKTEKRDGDGDGSKNDPTAHISRGELIRGERNDTWRDRNG